MDTNTATQGLPSQAKVLEEAKARRAKALAMADAGKKDTEIGEALGVTRQRAQQLVAKAKKDAGR